MWADFHRMDLVLKQDQESALATALSEMQPTDYCGPQPPDRSYEPATEGAEMFAFSWFSDYFGNAMYLKYSIVGSGPTEKLYVFSLHPSRYHRRRL